MRIFYNEESRKLIMKLPSRPHDSASRSIHNLVHDHVVQMGWDSALHDIGAARVKDHPFSKEPDESWIPNTLPAGRTDKWPSLVVESGFSETLRQLQRDAEWWLCRSRGDVKVVVIISVKRTEPFIVIQKWERDQNTLPLRTRQHQRQPRVIPAKTQEIILSRSAQNITTVIGAPLIIRFSDVFLRPSGNAQETDFSFSQQDLTALGQHVWRVQKFV
jgi:hypothetical protein